MQIEDSFVYDIVQINKLIFSLGNETTALQLQQPQIPLRLLQASPVTKQ